MAGSPKISCREYWQSHLPLNHSPPTHHLNPPLHHSPPTHLYFRVLHCHLPTCLWVIIQHALLQPFLCLLRWREEMGIRLVG